ncbi:MAG: cyclic nucleotide-binding/CBS domain-containing protein [Candidatus Hydrothermarchaeales archaeon]
MKKVYVKDIMHKITVIDATSSVAEAAKIMAEKNIGSVMVREEGEIDGILTERDILKKVVSKELDPRTTNVSEVMTKHPLIIDAKATIEDAAEIFNTVHIRRLPVLQRGEIVGIITSRDVARAIGK